MPPGRFIRGVTATPLGPLAVIGVCIPWDGAHVSGGRRDSRLWEQHSLYLEALDDILRSLPRTGTLLLGDFNQTVPRRRAPRTVYERLIAMLGSNLRLVTAGDLPGFKTPPIDHLACGHDFVATEIAALPNVDHSGARISDHTGMLIKLERLEG